jgi:hypothetical protein
MVVAPMFEGQCAPATAPPTAGNTTPRPQLASINSIGINGSGGVVQPMIVHDGMIDPTPATGPASTGSVPHSAPVSAPMGATMSVLQAQGLLSGPRMDELQQYANAVLGHAPSSAHQSASFPSPFFQHSFMRSDAHHRLALPSVYGHSSGGQINGKPSETPYDRFPADSVAGGKKIATSAQDAASHAVAINAVLTSAVPSALPLADSAVATEDAHPTVAPPAADFSKTVDQTCEPMVSPLNTD